MGDELKYLVEGKVIAKRWKIVKKLGEGGMGAVFKVKDNSKKYPTYAAMKVESDIADGGVIKLEVHVLQQLVTSKNAMRLLDFGQRDKFCYMVMTLLGPDLMHLKRLAGKPFSQCTTLRLGMASLFAIKQIHEIGYTHRDIKPGNCVIGTSGREAKCVYLIDYGMVRAFAVKDDGQMKMRKAREGEQLFRGTPRYCSLSTHYRKEQGRVDDLWSWLYMLVELHVGLPWRRLNDEKEILQMKESCEIDVLYKNCPQEFKNLHKYLEGIKFKSRPDYFGMWSECFSGMKRVEGSFLDPFEWEKPKEKDELDTAYSISERQLKGDYKKPKPNTLGKKLFPYANTANIKENVLGM